MVWVKILSIANFPSPKQNHIDWKEKNTKHTWNKYKSVINNTAVTLFEQ